MATTEKNQYEATCKKLKEDLEKKVGDSQTAGFYLDHMI